MIRRPPPLWPLAVLCLAVSAAGQTAPTAVDPPVDPPTAPAESAADLALRPSPAALRALCEDAFAGLARQTEKATPAAIVPATSGDALADFVVDYLHWCLGDERGVQLVERARLDMLLRELETQRLLGAEDITRRVAALAGGESVLVVAVHPVDPQTRDITLRGSRVEGGDVLFAAAPVRVEARDLVELQRQMVARGNRLLAMGLSTVLPGAGQLYNDQPIKAGLFLAVELALGAAALAYHLEGAGHEDAYNRDRPEDVPYGDRAESAYETRNVLLWTLLGVHVAGVVDAAIFGGVPPDVEQRFRDRIGVAPMGDGAGIWFDGRF